MMDDQTREAMDRLTSAFKHQFSGYIGRSITPDMVASIKTQLEDLICEIVNPEIKQRTDRLKFQSIADGDKLSLIPENFFTALCFVLVQQRRLAPWELPEDATEYTNDLGTYGWRDSDKALLFSPIIPAEHIVLNITVKDGSVILPE